MDNIQAIGLEYYRKCYQLFVKCSNRSNNNMSSTPQGIRNYSKMTDIDKAYLVKLLGAMGAAIIAGIVTGVMYAPNEGAPTGLVGSLLWLATTIGFTFLIKMNFDLGDWTNVRIFRHGVFVGLLTYLYIWVTIFNYIIL
jgi:hypothetical protein